jgi:ATP-dependent protease ClpP protease subunit
MQLFKDNFERKNGKVRMETTGNETTMYLYDAIGDWYGLSAKDFIQELSGVTADTLHLRINSPGGDVFEARAIATALSQCKKNIIAHIDGVCASAATYVALAANTVEMAQGSFFMIHQAWSLCMGNSGEMMAMADLLDKIDGSIVNDYQKKCGMDVSDIQKMMKNETWMTADEALANGFIDSIYDGETVENSWNLSAYEKTPDTLKENIAKTTEVVYDRDKFEKRLQLLEAMN